MRTFLFIAMFGYMPSTAAIGADAPAPAWLLGFWRKTSDEDHMQSDVMEFRAGGAYLNYGFNCVESPPLKFHVYDGEVYVRGYFRDKGPVAIMFHPSDDKKAMTFTSPRTRNNAVYERLASNPCAGK